MKHKRIALANFLIYLVAFALFSSVLFVTVPIASGIGEDWLYDWIYRKSHVVNFASGAGEGYQIRIHVYYGVGSDDGEDVYCSSECKTDFGDVRFTDDDGATELNYWMESKIDSNYAIFWVKINDSLESEAQTIYFYYGKADATTTSDGANTFLFFDDTFSSGWNLIYGTATTGVTDGQLWMQGDATNSFVGKAFSYDLTQNIKVISHNSPDAVAQGTYSNHQPIVLETNTAAPSACAYVIWTATSPDIHYAEANGLDQQITTGNVIVGTWYRTVFTYEHSTKTFKLTVDDTYKGSSTFVTAPPTSIMTIGITAYRDSHRIDCIAVAKFVDIEPSHGEWGEKEFFSYGFHFYFNDGGTFRVNCEEIENGSSQYLAYGIVLEFAAIVEHNYTFGNFSWNGEYSLSNPYNFTVSNNATVWCLFSAAGEIPTEFFGENGFAVAFILAIVLCASSAILIVYFRRKPDE